MGKKEMFASLLPYLQTCLAVGNLAIMLYALKTFLTKPQTTLENRVTTLEVELKEQKQSLLQGNDRFREQDEKFLDQDKTNEVIIRSVFALLEFEVHYCETEQKPISKNLEKAKDDLHDYLARK